MSRNHRILVPAHIARLMSPEDRKANGIETPEEEAQRHNLTLEREIHNQFGSWLYRHGFEDYYHSDPVRRPTIKAGLPDFGVYRDSRIIFIEIKIGKNDLSESQEIVFQRMGEKGNVILICRSYEQCVSAVIQFFNLPGK
jgi:hypothetical protein